MNADWIVSTPLRPLHSDVAKPRTIAQTEPLRALIEFVSSSGNIWAMRSSTESLALAGNAQASTVTSTNNSGKKLKKAQNAIIAA